MAWTPMLLLGLHPVARIPLAILPATRMKSAVKIACEMIVLVKESREDGAAEYSVRILCHFLACRRALCKIDEADYKEKYELKKAAYADTFHVQVVHTDTIRIY